MNYGNGSASITRKPIPIENIRTMQQVCFEMDDEIRWFVALLSDTSMRLAEAAGLAISDLHLDAEIPFVRLSEHRWRRLNTKKGSRRETYRLLVPLCGPQIALLKMLQVSLLFLDIAPFKVARLTMPATPQWRFLNSTAAHITKKSYPVTKAGWPLPTMLPFPFII